MHHKKILPAAIVLFSVTAVNAHASLSLTDNGLGVYDSGINATWTSDANLLGTLLGNLINTQGYNTIVNAIIAADPVIYDTNNGSDNNGSGQYKLSASDFGSGTADWWGAQAYVSYLNSLNNGAGYGGSNHWALPTTVDSSNSTSFPPSPSSSQLAELFYSELGGTASSSIPASSFFTNEQSSVYWSGTEYASDPQFAWAFVTNNGLQSVSNKNFKFYTWAVSPGQVTAVPLPGAAWMFGVVMFGALFKKSKKGQSTPFPGSA
jgi:hypothetical protein